MYCGLGLNTSKANNKDFLDLRGNHREMKLDGQWKFTWNRLTNDPSVLSNISKTIWFPEFWIDSVGAATYSIRFLIDNDKDWALQFPPAYSAYRAYLNGELISQSGVVAKKKELYEPKWVHRTVSISKEQLSDTNQLVLQVANFDHYKGGPTNSIIIGPSEWMHKKHTLVESLDIFLSGAMVMGGMFFLGMFLYGRQQKNILYFSLLCISFSYYVIGSGNHALHSLFSELSWYLTIRLEYSSLYLAIFFLTKFIEHTYPSEVNRLYVRTLAATNVLFLVIAIFGPVSFFTWIHKYYLVITAVMTVSALYVNTLAVIRRRTGAEYSLIAIVLLLGALAFRALNVIGLVDYSIYLVPLGYLSFFFLHSLTLSHQFAKVWKKAKEDAESSLKAKSDFLSVMSHEIRTPLNAVTGMTHHLKLGNPRPDQIETIDGLQFSADNLLTLINNILDFNKIEAGKIEFSNSVFELKDLGDKLLSGFKSQAQSKGNDLLFDCGFDKINVVADKGKLSQVLFNLVGNAIKFTKNGQITLVMNQVADSVTSTNIEFKVIDTGIGIEEAQIERIFETFSQADAEIHEKYGGSGLGLSICRNLLKLQGVELHVSSQVGIGSAFSFTQQFDKSSKTDKRSVKNKSTKHDAILENKVVLLVEDNAMNVLVVERFLKLWGMSILYANNGNEALEMLHLPFDIVLMDIQMPGISGIELSRVYRDKGITVPIIALTAAASEVLVDNIQQAGMNDFVIKPFHPDELQQKMKTHLTN